MSDAVGIPGGLLGQWPHRHDIAFSLAVAGNYLATPVIILVRGSSAAVIAEDAVHANPNGGRSRSATRSACPARGSPGGPRWRLTGAGSRDCRPHGHGSGGLHQALQCQREMLDHRRPLSGRRIDWAVVSVICLRHATRCRSIFHIEKLLHSTMACDRIGVSVLI
jgi:hypothetical protein